MLRFLELSPSPNNLRVRLALRYKGIDFEVTPVDPRDRSPVREVSGQDLTPVIADRGIVLNDSEAILHYLDANYPDTPRLWPPDRDGRKACEAWRERMLREVAAHWVSVFFHCIGLRDHVDEAARKRYQDALAALDSELGDSDSFHDRPVCDLHTAVWSLYALPGDGLIDRVGLFRKFRDVYAVPEGSLPNLERFLAPWQEWAA